jgi:hypothetical protein
MTLNTNALPERLLQLIKTDKVTLRETDGIISLIPVGEPTKSLQPQYDDSLKWLVDFHRLLDESIDEELLVDNFTRSRIIRKIESIDGEQRS